MHWRVQKWTHSPRIAEIRLPGLGRRDRQCMHAGEVYPANERGARLVVRVSKAGADSKDEGLLRRRTTFRTRVMSPVGYSQRSAPGVIGFVAVLVYRLRPAAAPNVGVL